MRNLHVVSLISLVLCVGCTKISHIKPIVTAQAIATETEELDAVVAFHDANFEKMLSDVRNSNFQVTTADQALNLYGNPVFRRDVVKDEVEVEEWLYRPYVEFSDTDKVFLYFDNQQQLINWTYIQGDQNEQIREET